MTTPVAFLKETSEELKKVVWPTKEQIIQSTIIVIILSLIVGLFLGGLDFVFTKLIDIII